MKQLDEHTQICLYLIAKYKHIQNYFTLDAHNGHSKITSSINKIASIGASNAYNLNEDLYNIARTFVDKFSIQHPDLGIIILMLSFAKYYSHNQYALFVYYFQEIEELEHIETFLLKSNSQINLKNLMIDEKYGIGNFHNRNNLSSITNKLLTLFSFITFSKQFFDQKFIFGKKMFHQSISQYPIEIIASFFVLLNVEKNIKLCEESKSITFSQLMYKFRSMPKIETSQCTNFEFYIKLPKNIIWFAYHQNKFTFTSYVKKQTQNYIKHMFDKLKKLIVGYLHNNLIVPLYIEDESINNWQDNYNYFKANNLPINFTNFKNHPPILEKTLYVMKENDLTIYKFFPKSY